MFDFDDLDDDEPDSTLVFTASVDVSENSLGAAQGSNSCSAVPASESASGSNVALLSSLADAMSDVLCLGEEKVWQAFKINMRSDGYAMLSEVLSARDVRSHVLSLAPSVAETDLVVEILEVPLAVVKVLREMAASLRCEDGHFRFELYDPTADDLGGWIRPTLSEIHEKSVAKESSLTFVDDSLSTDGGAASGCDIALSPPRPPAGKSSAEGPLSREISSAAGQDDSCLAAPRSPWYVPRPSEVGAQNGPAVDVKQIRHEGPAKTARPATEPGPSPLLRKCVGGSSESSFASSHDNPGHGKQNVPNIGTSAHVAEKGNAGMYQLLLNDDLEPPGPPPGVPSVDRQMPPGPPPGSPPTRIPPPPGPPPGSPPIPSACQDLPAIAPVPPPAPRRRPPPRVQPAVPDGDRASAVSPPAVVAPPHVKDPVTVAVPRPKQSESFRWADAVNDEEHVDLADIDLSAASGCMEASTDPAPACDSTSAKMISSAGADALDATTDSTCSPPKTSLTDYPAMEFPAAVQLPSGRFRGHLHEYFPDRGFGFTSCFGLPIEVFVHGRSFFFMPPRDLKAGAEIEFDLDCRHGRPRALNVLLLGGVSRKSSSVASCDPVAPHPCTVAPCRDAIAPPCNAVAPPRHAAAQPRDAVATARDAAAHPDSAAPRRDAVAPHADVVPRRRGEIAPSDVSARQLEGTRTRGRLRSFKPEGYGFVACDGLGDVHVPARAFVSVMPSRGMYGEDGPEVSFDLVQDECTGRMRAINAQLASEPELPAASNALDVAASDIPTEVLAAELLKRLSNSETAVREYFSKLDQASSCNPVAITQGRG